MDPVETYFKDLHEIRATGAGVPETSYYGALERLLNEVGKKLKPKVRCVLSLRNRGAGLPDGGLFTAYQFRRRADAEPLPGQKPERGAIEVKPTSDDAWVVADSRQVTRYWNEYRQVLVTNYRDFVLVGRDDRGKPVKLETIRLAADETEFWRRISHPRAFAKTHGARLVEQLSRVMLHAAELVEPKDVAWFLASYARDARAQIESVADIEALITLRTALEQALGLKFEGEKGEHFFRATLVQTLFYGIFSSWVLWSREHWGQRDARFNWHEAAWTLHVPMIAALFSQIATPTHLKPLGVDRLLDQAGMVLNRVDTPSFFEKFEETQAVQYFYEPFLKAYDPELRKELGVWYTPPEIVRYQVERVDRVLREELDIADGLADERVVILDPCCGTGAYLVETLRRIHETLIEKGGDALVAQRLKKAAIERVFGFEILPAPFVVSHLQIGLMLRQLGAQPDPESAERAGVYLTNALTGWEPPEKPKDQLPLFPELFEERDAANWVKREAPILVILGNPPYNAFAGTSPEEEGGLVEPYKEGLTKPVNQGGWGIKKFNLDDLYIRFFRIAERRIVKSGRGVVSYISNFSYLGDPSFVVMRQRFLEEFDKLWFDCMNGDSRETGKLTPEGKPDPSVFSTEQSPVGIRVGTAICVLVRKEKRDKEPTVRFQHYWGVTKRQDLLASLRQKNFDRRYDRATPTKANRYSFRPATVADEYLEWPRVVDLCAEQPTNGLMEKRGGALMDTEREQLVARMKAYFDPRVDWETYQSLGYGLEKKRAGIDPKKVRINAQRQDGFREECIVRYSVRPFDSVLAYYCPVPGVWNRARPGYWAQCWEGNGFFMTRFRCTARPEGVPCYFVNGLSDDHFMTPDNACFPVRLRHEPPKRYADEATREMFRGEEVPQHVVANLSGSSRAYLTLIGIRDPDADADTAGLIWMHALAIGYSPAYLSENADGIRQDWPRIPLPATKKALLASAALGREVAALVDTEKPVDGVTAGRIRPELKTIAVISKVGGGALDPALGHLDLTAGWGHAGKGGACMPGKGKYVERTTSDPKQKKAFGPKTLDVYLNETAYWANVPRAVWDYYIGGYQVIKKWLSYREKRVLGRGLKPEEAEYVTEMARRIAALILLQPALDENYRRVKSATYQWM